MLDEDVSFGNYLCEDGGGRRGLGVPIDEDWKNLGIPYILVYELIKR